MSTKMIEHVVLFKLKPNAHPSKVDAMVNGLNSLISLDQVLHLTAAPLLRIHSSSSLAFTHILHCRYNSKEDLDAYTVHPAHVSVVKETAIVVDDIMAVDWIADHFAGPVVLTPASVLRVTLFKLKQSLGENEKADVLEVVRGMENQFNSISQFTYGQNFSPNRAKGFSIALLMVCDGVDDLDSNSKILNLQMEKLSVMVEDELVLDYSIQSPDSGSI